jgi:hypothetical protein
VVRQLAVLKDAALSASERSFKKDMKKTTSIILGSSLFAGLVLVQAPSMFATPSQSKDATTPTTTSTTKTKTKSTKATSKTAAKTTAAPAAAPAAKPAAKTASTPAPAPAKAAAPAPAPAPAAAAAPAAKAAPAKAAKTPPPPPPNAGDIASAKAKGLVWLNLNTKVYHNSGDKEYGTTKNGKFVTEADAKAAGAKLAKN